MGRFLVQGKVVDGVDLEVLGPDVKTIEFLLSDGSRVQGRIELTTPQRAIEEKDELGNPVYNLNVSIRYRMTDIPKEFLGKPKAALKERKDSPEVM